MYIVQNKRKKGGKVYTYTFVVESRWNKEKQRSEKKILANISFLPQRTITTLKNSLQNKKDTVLRKNIEVERSVDWGYSFVILEIIKRLKIKKVFESSFPNDEQDKVKYAILMIIGKIVTRGSKLGIVNWIKRNREVALEIGFDREELDKLTEKKLYANQADINSLQNKVQKKWHLYNKKKLDTIYLYDITSFYFEGMENELACFGYNRDKKKGKKIITVGLITDKNGFPLKVQVFKGNTKDEKTVSEQIKDLKEEFKAKKIILVGDRGMKIRLNLKKMEEAKEGSSKGVYYITGLTTAEIKTLEENGIIQMSLFDKQLKEIEQDGKRYILCVNPYLKKEKQMLRQTFRIKFEEVLLSVKKSFQREKKRCKANRARIKKEGKNSKNKNLKVKLTKKEIASWEYKTRKAQEKYKMQKIYTVTINGKRGKETMNIDFDFSAYEQQGRFDGKYIFETTAPKKELDKEEVRGTYKELQKVEHAFRDMKQSRLNLRPIFHRKEETTRAHVFLGMFSYAIIHEMENRIFPFLAHQRENNKNNKSGKDNKNKNKNKNDKDRLSFNDIIEELKMIKLCILSFSKTKPDREIRITKLNENQKKILSLLNINKNTLKNFLGKNF